MGLFWYNGKRWKSKEIDEASKKGEKGKVKDTKSSWEVKGLGGIAPGPHKQAVFYTDCKRFTWGSAVFQPISQLMTLTACTEYYHNTFSTTN